MSDDENFFQNKSEEDEDDQRSLEEYFNKLYYDTYNDMVLNDEFNYLKTVNFFNHKDNITIENYLYEIGNKMFNAQLYRDISRKLLKKLYKKEKPICWLKGYIRKSKERKYIKKQLEKINNDIQGLKKFKHLIISKKGNSINVKIYCHFGTNGYSVASKNMVKSMFIYGVNIQVKIFRIYNYVKSNSETDKLVSSLTKNRLKSYNYVIIHGTPPSWERIIKLERNKNPNVIIVGFTVWEADRVPSAWLPHLYETDHVVVPCKWNLETFKLAVKNVSCIETPIDSNLTCDENFSTGFNPKDDFIFYTINAWNNRKGILDLIDCFLELFDGIETVKLYIKTFDKRNMYHP